MPSRRSRLSAHRGDGDGRPHLFGARLASTVKEATPPCGHAGHAGRSKRQRGNFGFTLRIALATHTLMGLLTTMTRSTLFAAAATIGGPDGAFAALIAKVVEDLWADQEQYEIEQRVAALEQALGKNPAAVGDNLTAILRVLASHVPAKALRHTTSCLAVIRALNTRSEHGTYWDPHLEEDDLADVLREIPNISSPEGEVELVVHELHRVGLVKRRDTSAGTSIGPADDFFARTDVFFQPWDPVEDARTLCRRARDGGEDRILPGKFDRDLGWGPRRMNAAIALLEAGGKAEGGKGPMDNQYLTHEMFLTPEATFFLEE